MYIHIYTIYTTYIYIYFIYRYVYYILYTYCFVCIVYTLHNDKGMVYDRGTTKLEHLMKKSTRYQHDHLNYKVLKMVSYLRD